MGRVTSKITLNILLVRPESYINDVTNINLIDNKANIKGTCNKDDINMAVFPGALRSSRHYLVRAQSQGHHAIDRLEQRGVERGSARRSSLKGRERASVSQTNIGTVSKATLGKLVRDGVGRIHYGLFRARRYHLEPN